jgi:hypothetical protein
MLIPLGILASAGGIPPIVSDYELISTTILGSTTASVTFSGLNTYSSTYKHLQIRYVAKSNRASDYLDWIRLDVNGAAITKQHYLAGAGGAVGSGSDNNFIGYIGGDLVANSFGAGVIDLLDSYSTTKNKTIRALSGFRSASGGSEESIMLASAFVNNTAIISSLTLDAGFGNLITGTRVSLYGVK